MNKKNYFYGTGRRDFLITGGKLAASTTLLSLGGFSLMSAIEPYRADLAIPVVQLNNGLNMPMLGFGTYSLRGKDCETYVAQAIEVGYRLFDTATIYGNEEFVGAGIKNSGIDRKELFITSKVWVDDSGYDNTIKAFETSINKLGTDYLDLYLIHRPRGDVKGSWKAMEDLYKEGKIKAIGISNFEPDQINELHEYANVKPTVNQIETHAFFQQSKSLEYLEKHDVQMEAWAPFAEGRNELFSNETLVEIGKKYQKSNAQVSLRWHLQRGIVSIPRTSKKAHMIENLDIFDFELDASDMETIAKLDLNITQFPEWS